MIASRSLASRSTAIVSAPTPQVLKITPDAIRKLIVSRNTTVLQSMNSVYIAKEQVNSARAALLPSVNLNALLLAPTSFGLSAVSVLMPFFLPSNWFNLDSSQYNLTASGLAYEITRLNTYASALSMYVTILADMDARKSLYRQYLLQKSVEDQVKITSVTGDASPGDLDYAHSQVETTLTQVYQLDRLISQETTSFRTLFSLPLSAKIEFTETHPTSLTEELWSPIKVYESTYFQSPEYLQARGLLEASRSKQGSAVFGFLTDSSLVAQPSPNGGGFVGSKFAPSQSVSIGFGIFPAVRLAELDTRAMRIQLSVVRDQARQTVLSVLTSIEKDIKALASSTEAEISAKSAFELVLKRYQLGQIDLLHVVTMENNLLSASVNRIRVRQDLDAERITLARIMIVGQFARIPKCRISVKSDPDVFAWVDEILDGSSTKLSVDEMCQRQTARRSAAR